jgi:hypothetical protein
MLFVFKDSVVLVLGAIILVMAVGEVLSRFGQDKVVNQAVT